MPQMMPINWIISFILFILIFILFNILNYYIFTNNNPNPSKKFFNINNNKNYFHWKW